jgi:hypothetical protein
VPEPVHDSSRGDFPKGMKEKVALK